MLHVATLSGALEIIDRDMPKTALRPEHVPLRLALGRTLAQDIAGNENIPAFDRSTMDGFAVRAADTFGAGETLPAMLKTAGEVYMGAQTYLAVTPGTCVKIPTGGMLPAEADAVIPVEYTELTDDGLCLCYKAVSPLQNVTKAGDDVRAGQTVFIKGTVVTPAVVGVLAAMGVAGVAVFSRPKVGIISTGDELVPAETQPQTGQVRDVNAPMLAALCGSLGFDCRSYGIIEDKEEKITAAVQRAAAENDLVLLSGGSSAGDADNTARVIARLGTVFCHGIAVKPGKPTILGQVAGKAVFGLPGHPAACYFMTALLVRRQIEALYCSAGAAHTVCAVLSAHVSSNHGREELLCVRIKDGEAEPVYGKSGIVSQLSAADGFLVIPRDCEGLQKGTQVSVHLF